MGEVGLRQFCKIAQEFKPRVQRMRALGYNVWLYKYFDFILVELFAELARILQVYYNGFVSPGEPDIRMSTEVVTNVCVETTARDAIR